MKAERPLPVTFNSWTLLEAGSFVNFLITEGFSVIVPEPAAGICKTVINELKIKARKTKTHEISEFWSLNIAWSFK